MQFLCFQVKESVHYCQQLQALFERFVVVVAVVDTFRSWQFLIVLNFLQILQASKKYK